MPRGLDAASFKDVTVGSQHACALTPDDEVRGRGTRAATPQLLQQYWETNGSGFALHNADLSYAMGDLLQIVSSQAARR
jgi:hypothetical protein